MKKHLLSFGFILAVGCGQRIEGVYQGTQQVSLTGNGAQTSVPVTVTVREKGSDNAEVTVTSQYGTSTQTAKINGNNTVGPINIGVNGNQVLASTLISGGSVNGIYGASTPAGTVGMVPVTNDPTMNQCAASSVAGNISIVEDKLSGTFAGSSAFQGCPQVGNMTINADRKSD